MADYYGLLQEGMVLFLYLNFFMLVLWPIIFVIEKLNPVHRDLRAENYWFNWKVSLSNCVLGPVFAGLAFVLTFSFASAIGAPFLAYPSFSLGIGLPIVDVIIEGACLFFIACVISDLGYYWWHRFQHTVPALWELHKLHHSEERMNHTTMPRSHFLEQSGQAIFRGLSVGLIFDLSGKDQTTMAVICAGVLPAAWNFLIHSNVRLSFLQRLPPFFSTPQYHRVHHSALPEHQDVNFAVFIPFIDVLFGSYCKPAKDEFPPTGLSSGEQIDNLYDAQVGPLKIWWQTLFSSESNSRQKFAYPITSDDR